MTHYEQSLEWINEYLASKHPELTPYEKHGNQYWLNEFTEFVIFQSDFECNFFGKRSVEVGKIVFSFIIPPTKEEFFAVLLILDK